MMINGINIDMEKVRCELERRFFPSFGMPLDIATMVLPLDPPQDGDPRLFAPPPELQDIYNPRLIDSQWKRLIDTVRDPVKEIRSAQGYRALQILGQTVLLQLPNGLLHAWVWDSNRERGMHLKRLSHDAVALSGQFFDNDWLLRLADLANLEIRCHVSFDEMRACAYGAWTFEIFGKVLSEHADLAWMRTRIQHRLALDPAIAGLASRTIAPIESPGCVTVGQYNHVWRRLAVLKDVRRDDPQLVGIYAALCSHEKFPENGEPIQRLKQFLKAQGLTQRGWNLVLSLTAADLAPLYEIYVGNLPQALLDYVLVLDTLGFHDKRPSWFVVSVLSGCGGIPNANGALRREFVERNFLAHASHVVRAFFDEKGYPCESKKHEVTLVLDWLINNPKRLTRTQRQGGWEWLLRKAREWEAYEAKLASAQDECWQVPVKTLQIGSLHLRAITTTHDLWAEGKAMSHCVGSYAPRCLSGESLVFSVWMTGRHIATAEYRLCEQAWCLHSALGPRNSILAPKIQFWLRSAASKINHEIPPRFDTPTRRVQ